LRNRYGPKLDYAGKVAPSCIHCHQDGAAHPQIYRDRKERLPDQMLFPYPHPRVLGLVLDPKERATVLRTDPGSSAGKAGFEKGDVVLTLEGQPLLSIADVQWVLHNASVTQESIEAEVRRGDRTVKLTLSLPKGWRQRDDLSWRASTWALRRMAAGGMLLEVVPAAEQKKLKLSDTGMALRVRHLGTSGPHGAAHRAGFRRGDVLVSFDGHDDLHRETDLLAYALNRWKVGDQVPVTVLREGKKIEFKLPMQQ
jgi:S1-C subfamily serine protease